MSINLKDYDSKYRLGVDESHYADRNSTTKRSVSGHNLILRGTRGHVYFHSPERLGVSTNYRGQMPKKLIKAGCRIEQAGDDGINASFDPVNLEKIALIVGLYRRQRLTEAQRADRAARMREITRKRARDGME